MTQESPVESVKVKTYSFTLYPTDVALITNLAAEQFRYNTSEALRYILSTYRAAQAAAPDAQVSA